MENHSDTEPVLTPAEQVEHITEQALEALHAAHIASEDLPPLEVDGRHVLHGDNCDYMASPKHSPLATVDGEIDAIVWHVTDTRSAGAAALARRIARSEGRAASWHICIDREGKIMQSIPLNLGAWHTGSDTAKRFKLGPGGLWQITDGPGMNPNRFACGIELENVGEVREHDGKWLGWPFDPSRPERPIEVPASEVSMSGSGRGWHTFTAPQIAAAKRVLSALVRRYHLLRPNCAWGHIQIDPRRRVDPGELFMGHPVPTSGVQPGSILAVLIGAVFDAVNA